VALWLESHNPGEPLGFLDHHIKCGDSIVGLAHIEELKKGIPNEAFKSLPGDDKEIASAFLKRNKVERGTEGQLTADFENIVSTKMTNLIEAFNQFNRLPENTAQEILTKEKEYKRLIESRNWQKLKEIANLMVAQFFIPKTLENKNSLVTHSNYLEYLYGTKGVPGQASAKSIVVCIEKNFFHWFLEFPEIFINGGFDCILGNPPFLNGTDITRLYNDAYNEYLVLYFNAFSKKTDICGYFFRRDFDLINLNGFLSLIATNTISQGTTRKSSLDAIEEKGGRIIFAIDSVKWPGKASVIISMIAITKINKEIKAILNGKEEKYITPLLKASVEKEETPFILSENIGKAFQGSCPYGDEFILEIQQSQNYYQKQGYIDVIRPYIGGHDLNNQISREIPRLIINFKELDEFEARKYVWPFEYLEANLKPKRILMDARKYPRLVNEWWKFWHSRQELYRNIEILKLTQVFARSRVSNLHMLDKIPQDWTFSEALVIYLFDSYEYFSLLQSSIHQYWAEKYRSTMKTDTRYIVSDCFETFPFPHVKFQNNQQILVTIGKQYCEIREWLMSQLKLGLTKTYNLFHNKELRTITADEERLEDKLFEKKFGKNLSFLRKHLAKTPGTISFNEAVYQVFKLRDLHIEMDKAVLDAYGWSDIPLKHDFYEVDYLPENDRVRYTIHPDARREILKRLLELNHKIHEEEVAAGLWDKKGGSKKSKKSITETGSVEDPEGGYGGLFGVNE
jgi:hypothetical protein